MHSLAFIFNFTPKLNSSPPFPGNHTAFTTRSHPHQTKLAPQHQQKSTSIRADLAESPLQIPTPKPSPSSSLADRKAAVQENIKHRNVRSKALAINLDSSKYGSFAEIGAAQEVSRWFFRAGAAAGTIAKSISAYDMTVSDIMYDKASRYVSEERLEQMLETEFHQVRQALNATRGSNTCFFAFADTVAAKAYNSNRECHGWLGLMFQAAPGQKPSTVKIHVRMLDNTAEAQGDAIGIIGVNLIYACLYHSHDLDASIGCLFDDIQPGRLLVDYVKFSGDEFAEADERLVALRLIQEKLAEAMLFIPTSTGNFQAKIPADSFYKKSPVILRGRFRPTCIMHAKILNAACEEFRLMINTSKDCHDNLIPVLELTTGTLSELNEKGTIEDQDFLNRFDMLATLNIPILVSAFSRHVELAQYIHRYTSMPIGLTLGAESVRRQLFQYKTYEDLEGGILEAFGKLFKNNSKVLVYPTLDSYGHIINSKNVDIDPNLQKLYEYLFERGLILDIHQFRKEYLARGNISKEALKLICQGNSMWKNLVSPQVSAIIESRNLYVDECLVFDE